MRWKAAVPRSTVAVIGAGNWGTAFAKVLADAGSDVWLWARREQVAEQINRTGENSQYLPGVKLPHNLHASADLAAVVGQANKVFLAVPSQQLRGVLQQMQPFLRSDTLLVSLIKGVEKHTNLRMSQVITQTLDWDISRVAVLTGPNIALEIAQEQPTGAVVSCVDIDTAQRVAKLATTKYFKTYITTDVTGTELGGVLKNLIALAIGIVDEVGYGENTKAAIITRGIAEMNEFAVASGAHPNTMMGLAGLGDLITTCRSPLSRNFTAGRLIAQGLNREQVVARMQQVAEGLSAIGPVLELAAKRAVAMPIVEQVQLVLDGAITPYALAPHLATEDDLPAREASAGRRHHLRGFWHHLRELTRL